MRDIGAVMKNKRFAIVVVGASFLVLFCLAAEPKREIPQNTPGVLRARAFELVDDAGKIRASITVETNGSAVFRMRDAEGTIRVKIDAKETGSGLLLLDETTNPGVQVLAGRDGTRMTIVNQNGAKRVIEP
jgi:hypothetical protein